VKLIIYSISGYLISEINDILYEWLFDKWNQWYNFVSDYLISEINNIFYKWLFYKWNTII
jgi:hypothetical protein